MPASQIQQYMENIKNYLFKKIPTESKHLKFPKKGKGGKEAFKIARKYFIW